MAQLPSKAMKQKIRTVAVVILATTAISTPAFAENFNHIRQLLSTRRCQQCELSNAGLRLANLTGADLQGADLSLANFDQANLSRANLSNANLTGAVLFRANLGNANLAGADLSGANLAGAYLVGVDFTGANLAGADLTGAIVNNAIFTGSRLEQVNLQGVTGLPGGLLKPEDYYLLAFQEARVGQHRNAIANYDQAIKLSPDFAAAYLGRGVTRLQLGDAKGAMTDWKKSEELFKAQGNNNGLEVSKQFITAMEQRQRGRRGNMFMNVVNSVAPLLLRFIGL